MITDIELELKHVTNIIGQQIVCMIEARRVASSSTSVVIVVPPYAKAMRDLLVTSMYMSHNGFRAARFDFSNHVGLSDGRVFDFTLSSAVADLQTFVASVRSWFPEAKIGVITSSLGSRVALRALKERADIHALVSLVGVVNVRATLHRVIGTDLIEQYTTEQSLPDSKEVLGYEIGSRFIVDIVETDIFSLESTKEDMRKCRFPIIEIAAENDAWTDLQEVDDLFHSCNGSASRESYVLPSTSHKLENNPSAARMALRLAVVVLKRELDGERGGREDIAAPAFTEVVRRNRAEREIMRSSATDRRVERRLGLAEPGLLQK